VGHATPLRKSVVTGRLRALPGFHSCLYFSPLLPNRPALLGDSLVTRWPNKGGRTATLVTSVTSIQKPDPTRTRCLGDSSRRASRIVAHPSVEFRRRGIPDHPGRGWGPHARTVRIREYGATAVARRPPSRRRHHLRRSKGAAWSIASRVRYFWRVGRRSRNPAPVWRSAFLEFRHRNAHAPSRTRRTKILGLFGATENRTPDGRRPRLRILFRCGSCQQGSPRRGFEPGSAVLGCRKADNRNSVCAWVPVHTSSFGFSLNVERE
jgi:hypothetical protein